MDIFSVILIAFGLSMDAFAVSVTNGITIKDLKIQSCAYNRTLFGGFQALMPLAGGWRVNRFRTT